MKLLTASANKVKRIVSTIRTIRQAKGYTQEYIGMKLGISQNSYSKIELGYVPLTLERLIQIAEVLEVDAYSLLFTHQSISQTI